MEDYSPRQIRCKIIIIGAGIGGLTAAIAARKAGHEVHVYEQSSFASETGAAIHLTPNANSVLHQIGIDHETGGGSRLGLVRFYNASGELLRALDVKGESHRWQRPWLQTHRVDIHNHLKRTALSETNPGLPVQIHTASRVTAVDAQLATITLDSGEVVQADVVVGADGVRSNARLAISNERQYKPDKAVQNAFRFMISLQRIREDPRTADFMETLDSMDMYYADDRKVVMYLCSGATVLNFVCCHPAHLTGEFHGGYSHGTSKASLLDVYKEFSPTLLEVMAKVGDEDVKVHPLLDMDTLPTYANNRLVVIGDAAHPFTPHLAQGAAMAIEDGVSFGVLVSNLDSKDEITGRLQLFNKARYERATLIQEMTRMTGNEPTRSSTSSQIQNWKVHEFLQYGFSHDEVHHSTQLLREYQWSKAPQLRWRQPVGFGPMASPRQQGLNSPRPDGLSAARSTVASIRFRTSATLLRNLFPSTAYSFVKRDTVAEASFIFQAIDNLSWLGGGGYNLVMFQIHGIRHLNGDGSSNEGSYIPLVLEDLADPIISGREDLGWPKLYSDIAVKKGSEAGDLLVELSWRGAKWASFSWNDLQVFQQEQTANYVNNRNGHINGTTDSNGDQPRQTNASESLKDNDVNPKQSQGGNLFVHKYIPATTDSPQRKTADADYDVMMPPSTSTVEWQKVANHASFEISPRTAKELPTLHHIASRLFELPVFGIVEAKMGKSQGQDDFASATRVS